MLCVLAAAGCVLAVRERVWPRVQVVQQALEEAGRGTRVVCISSCGVCISGERVCVPAGPGSTAGLRVEGNME